MIESVECARETSIKFQSEFKSRKKSAKNRKKFEKNDKLIIMSSDTRLFELFWGCIDMLSNCNDTETFKLLLLWNWESERSTLLIEIEYKNYAIECILSVCCLHSFSSHFYNSFLCLLLLLHISEIFLFLSHYTYLLIQQQHHNTTHKKKYSLKSCVWNWVLDKRK